MVLASIAGLSLQPEPSPARLETATEERRAGMSDMLVKHTLKVAISFLVIVGLVGAQTQAKQLTEAETKRLDELVRDAQSARVKGDLVRVADLLSQAIAIDPAPSFRWNLARVYEGLCRYKSASQQFAALESDAQVAEDIREKAALRNRGLARYIEAYSYRTRVKTEGAKVYVNGKEVAMDSESQVLEGLSSPSGAVDSSTSQMGLEGAGPRELEEPSGPVVIFEIYKPGSFRTRLRAEGATLGQCITIGDDLDASVPSLALLRLVPEEPLETLELTSGDMKRHRIRADLTKLRELELPAGDYEVEGRTANGERLAGTIRLEAGASADLSLTREGGKRLQRRNPGDGTLVGVRGGFRLKPGSWGWITAGSGIALLAAGIVVRMDAEALMEAYKSDWNDFSLAPSAIEKRYEDVFVREQTAWIVMGIGAAATVAGAVLLLNEVPPSTEGSVNQVGSSFTVSPGLDGSVQMQVRF